MGMPASYGHLRDADGVVAKFGIEPTLILDFLALVGDAADGFLGIPRIGRVSSARLLNQHGPIESFPESVLGERLDPTHCVLRHQRQESLTSR
jgi:5'-3' exonuclease